MSNLSRVERDLADLGSLRRTIDKAKILVELWRSEGPFHAASVFSFYSEHNNDAIQLYALFVARLADFVACQGTGEAQDVADSLVQMAEVVVKRRG